MRSARCRSSRPSRNSHLQRWTSALGYRPGSRRGRWGKLPGVVVALAALALIGTAFAPESSAAQTVQLGTVSPFAVLGATAVTDVPTSVITGDVGLSPAAGSNYAGLTQAEVTGTIYSTNVAGPAGSVDDPALLTTAQNDLTTAYLSANGQPATTTFTTGDNQLGGKTLTPGVYAFGAAATANITAASPLVLDGNGVYVFQASSSLITGSGSVVRLEGGAQACNVFWTVGSSATLGSGSTFVGTLMALTSATLDSAATVEGRILARNAAVTLDADTITVPPTCTRDDSDHDDNSDHDHDNPNNDNPDHDHSDHDHSDHDHDHSDHDHSDHDHSDHDHSDHDHSDDIFGCHSGFDVRGFRWTRGFGRDSRRYRGGPWGRPLPPDRRHPERPVEPESCRSAFPTQVWVGPLVRTMELSSAWACWPCSELPLSPSSV